MNFSESLSYQFKDADFLKKMVLTGLITLIPVVGLVYLMGWIVEIIRRVVQGEEPVLPDVRFGQFLGDGFRSLVIYLVYSIPEIVLLIIYGVLLAVATPSMTAGSANNGNMPNVIAAVTIICSICLVGLAILASLIPLVFSPLTHGILAETGKIGPALKFQEVFALLKAAPGAVVLALLGLWLGGFISGLGGIIIIGTLFTLPYGASIYAHLFGQAYKAAKGNLAYK